MSDVERLATLESDTRYVKQKLDKIDSDVEEIKRGLNKQKLFIATKKPYLSLIKK